MFEIRHLYILVLIMIKIKSVCKHRRLKMNQNIPLGGRISYFVYTMCFCQTCYFMIRYIGLTIQNVMEVYFLCAFSFILQRGAIVSEPAIQVRRKGRSTQVWTIEKLENKLIDMRDLYQEWKENVPEVKGTKCKGHLVTLRGTPRK